MNILIFNWRDIKNPYSGGAEILTHELAKRLVKKGHRVVIFASYFKNARKEEKIDDVKIIREGHQDARTLFKSVHYRAFLFYRKNRYFDLVVDEIHGVPFFTPFFVRGKKVALICEVAGELWDYAVKFPFNVLGRILEKVYPFFYKDFLAFTISESSKKEMQKLGFKKIYVLPMGCSTPVIKFLPKKEKNPTLIFLARVSKTKGAEDAIKVVSLLNKKIPNINLWIVGGISKEYKNSLRKYINKLRISKNVKIWEFINEDKKENLLERSHLIILPSQKEGSGLTVHEAGARGTPAVAYNVPGLRDVVKDGINGIICWKNTPEDLANNILSLLKNKKLYEKLQKGAIKERKIHDWNKTTDEFLEGINTL